MTGLSAQDKKALPFFKLGEVEVAPSALEALLNPGVPTIRPGETQAAIYTNTLRFPAAAMDAYKDADAGEPTPANLWTATECAWRPEAKNFRRTVGLVRHLFAELGGERLGAALILRLPIGQSVKPHCDSGLYTNYFDRLFVPLICDPGNTFRVGSHEFTMSAGDVWTGNFKLKHSAFNGSNRDRYVLVVDFN